MSVQDFLIPLDNFPETFDITLNGVDYQFTSKWNDIAQCWFLDIADAQGVPLAFGIPFITGENLLAGLAYLNIKGGLYVQTQGTNAWLIPTLDNLGVTSNLYFEVSGG